MENAPLDGGSASAPAQPTGTPLADDTPLHNNPLGSQTPTTEAKPAEPAKADPQKAPTPSEAIKQAMEQVKAKAGEKVDEAKAKADAARQEPQKDRPGLEKVRDETGKFRGREQDGQQPLRDQQAAQQAGQNPSHREPPSRFDDAAKAEWANAPESVKGAVHRTIRELEQGVQKYRADSEAYDRVRQFDEIARSNGRELRQSLEKVVAIEQAFARNPVQALDMILRELGGRKQDGSPLTLMDIAYSITRQTPDQRSQQQNSQIASLEGQIRQLQQTISMLQPTVTTIQNDANERVLSQWSQDKPHFQQLRKEVVAYVAQGLGADESYARAVHDFEEKARAFGFSPSANAAHTGTSDPALAQTQARTRPLKPEGQKSISGAPSNGIDPKEQPIIRNNRDAIKEALRRVAS